MQVDQVSISSTFYSRLFRNFSVITVCFFVIFWQKNIGAKAGLQVEEFEGKLILKMEHFTLNNQFVAKPR